MGEFYMSKPLNFDVVRVKSSLIILCLVYNKYSESQNFTLILLV